MFKKPTTSIIFHIILIFTVIISMKSCIAKGNDPDAIYSLKNSRFSSYGSQTLETAAEDSLTDLQWICSEEPISFDGGYVYEAALSGHSEEHDLDVSIGFTVTLGYRVKNTIQYQ